MGAEGDRTERAARRLMDALHEAAEVLTPDDIDYAVGLVMVDHRSRHGADVAVERVEAAIDAVAAEEALRSEIRRAVSLEHPANASLSNALNRYEAAQVHKAELEKESQMTDGGGIAFEVNGENEGRFRLTDSQEGAAELDLLLDQYDGDDMDEKVFVTRLRALVKRYPGSIDVNAHLGTAC